MVCIPLAHALRKRLKGGTVLLQTVRKYERAARISKPSRTTLGHQICQDVFRFLFLNIPFFAPSSSSVYLLEHLENDCRFFASFQSPKLMATKQCMFYHNACHFNSHTFRANWTKSNSPFGCSIRG